jgi:hypothetical protein
VYQYQYDLGNEESVKEFFRQHGYNFEVVVEQVRTRRAGVPILDVFNLSRSIGCAVEQRHVEGGQMLPLAGDVRPGALRKW